MIKGGNMLQNIKKQKQIERYRGYVIIDGITYTTNNEEKASRL